MVHPTALKREIAYGYALIGAIRSELHRIRLGLRQRKYRPDQPRVPAGQPDGGQWTSDGPTAAGGEGTRVLIGGSGNDDLPEIPQRRPETSSERTAIKKELSRELNNRLILRRALGPLLELVAATEWLKDSVAEIWSYTDGPKTLQELQEAAQTPRRGYQIHHIVEQGAARRDGIQDWRINDPENLVSIPTVKHYEITKWFQSRQEYYNDMTPREYLRDASWPARYSVGLDALRISKVLKD